MGRHHLPAAICQAWRRLLSSSSRSAASRQQEHSAWDGRTEHSSAPCLYGKPTNTSHQSKQLLARLHCPKSLAQSWPGREGCKEGRLKGKPLQLGSRTGSTKGCPGLPGSGTPGQGSKSALAGAIPFMPEAVWLLQAGSEDTVPTAFPSHPARLPLQKPHSSSPGLTPQPGSP